MIKEPFCNHKRKGIVTSGTYHPDAPHAATNVCDRPQCVADAKRWVKQITGLNATVKLDAQKPTRAKPEPDSMQESLFT